MFVRYGRKQNDGGFMSLRRCAATFEKYAAAAGITRKVTKPHVIFTQFRNHLWQPRRGDIQKRKRCFWTRESINTTQFTPTFTDRTLRRSACNYGKQISDIKAVLPRRCVLFFTSLLLPDFLTNFGY